ncbi:ABC transporter substrate-binding protein [Actinomadura sp. 9N407]|uniref:ABC transporter substrate-binding protein n=1 Tax=Actinomadura sp. 9N407 TaxID=3375154 RepID=UPI00379A34B4
MVSERSDRPRPYRPRADRPRADRPRPARSRPYRTRGKAMVAGAALLALVAAGCGGAGEDGAGEPVPGITEAPCPKPVNKEHGCIYLGTISDLTAGPFRLLGGPLTRAQQAFWDRVNKDGGIGGYDIDVRTYVRDNKYDPATHRRAYLEIKDKVLALAQSLGSPTTGAILNDLRANRMIAVPASYPSKWEFENVILEAGASYCFEAMNAVDYAVDNFKAESAMAIYFPGDYGGDAAAGAKIAANARGLSYAELPTKQGADGQEAAIAAILERKPDVVVLTTGPVEAATIVAKTVQAGFQGQFMGSNPTWGKDMLRAPSFPVMKAKFWYVAPWKPFAYDSPGNTAMRQAVGRVEPDDSYATGWITSYALQTVLEKAAANKNLTRDGVYEALGQVTTVDYEGMLPAQAGNFSGTPNSAAFRQSVMSRPDEREYTGTRVITDFYAGPTARNHRLDTPCYNPK